MTQTIWPESSLQLWTWCYDYMLHCSSYMPGTGGRKRSFKLTFIEYNSILPLLIKNGEWKKHDAWLRQITWLALDVLDIIPGLSLSLALSLSHRITSCLLHFIVQSTEIYPELCELISFFTASVGFIVSAVTGKVYSNRGNWCRSRLECWWDRERRSQDDLYGIVVKVICGHIKIKVTFRAI